MTCILNTGALTQEHMLLGFLVYGQEQSTSDTCSVCIWILIPGNMGLRFEHMCLSCRNFEKMTHAHHKIECIGTFESAEEGRRTFRLVELGQGLTGSVSLHLFECEKTNHAGLHCPKSSGRTHIHSRLYFSKDSTQYLQHNVSSCVFRRNTIRRRS
jgi:hypothetical protein